jgi:hypothetical protein
MEDVRIKIEEIYVPAKWRTTIEPAKVESLAESILEALGEDSIAAVVVGSPQH